MFGYIVKLSPAKIHVPLKHRKIFDAIIARGKTKKDEFGLPRYEVKLAFGSRLEPWIVTVSPLSHTLKN